MLALLLTPLSLVAQAEWYSDTQAIMGTRVSLIFWFDLADSDSGLTNKQKLANNPNLAQENDRRAQEIIVRVMDEMRRIDASYSPYREDSELSKINRLALAQAQPLSDELFALIDRSLYYSELSEGAFDITFASLGRFYDYRNKLRPDEKKRLDMLEAINYRHLQLDRKSKTVFFAHPHVYIDLGGIAKGYAVDQAANILRASGVRHATISAGGDSRVIGDKRGQPWMIGIKNPRQAEGGPDSLIRMPLEDVAVSTSGDYERFFIDEETNERVHHILNPKTGKSAQGIVSVTIIGELGMDTDALSTTVFVMGVERGLALINRMPNIDCVIIDARGQAHYSHGLMDPSVNWNPNSSNKLTIGIKRVGLITS